MKQRFMAGRSLADLRRRIASLEGRSTVTAPGIAPLRLAPVDGSGAALPGDGLPLDEQSFGGLPSGGLARGALHEVVADETRQGAVAAGFTLALVAQLARERSGAVMWVVDGATLAEVGPLHGDGLHQMGIDPARMLVVKTRSPEDTLWALEEGAGCRGLVSVVGEFQRAPKALDLTATRRLALRARAGGVSAFVLRHGQGQGLGHGLASHVPASAAVTRWRLEAAPSGHLENFSGGVGRPTWRARLERNRQGRTGTFDLEWNHDKRIFQPAAHRQPVAAEAGERPDRASATGQVVALRRSS
jgi:protein ImuA